jgi:hypothetical protein
VATKFGQRTCLELANAFARHLQACRYLLKRLWRFAVESKSPQHHEPKAILERRNRVGDLMVARTILRVDVGARPCCVFDDVRDSAAIVSDGHVERDRVGHDTEIHLDARRLHARFSSNLVLCWFPIELLAQAASRALGTPYFGRDVRWQTNRAALLVERAPDCLANPPCRVR